MLSSELAPFAKTGGLGDAVAGLARFLASQGVEQRVFLPYYSSAKVDSEKVLPVDFLQDMRTELAGHTVRYGVHTTLLPDSDLPIYLVHCPALYDRRGIYDDRGDEHLRYALLARAAIESCQRMGFAPDVFHLHDWHTALLPIYLKTVYGWDRLFAGSRTLLTIHNLGYQGSFPASEVEALGFGGFRSQLYQEQLGRGLLNFMTNGIVHADFVSTVSPTHARELQTPDYGFGLDPLLRARADHFIGIVNGVDYGEWDPAVDPLISHTYSSADLEGKEWNKKALLEGSRPPLRARSPGAGRGLETHLPERLRPLLRGHPGPVAPPPGPAGGSRQRRDALRTVLLPPPGALPRPRLLLQRLQQPARPLDPGRQRHVPGALADSSPAASPRCSPCATAPSPIVRRTGGLADTVELYDSAQGTGTGFVFDHFESEALRWALDYALDSYADRERWRELMLRGMAQDFSWEKQGLEYLELYRRI